MAQRVTQSDMQSITGWCQEHKIQCLYLLLDANDRESLTVANAVGAKFVDTRITLESRTYPLPAKLDSTIREATQKDVPLLMEIARASHRDTRFYFDGNFDMNRCDDLYGTWISNSVSGWADRVFVATTGAQPIGYVTCKLDSDFCQIGLIAVHFKCRGRGIGQALIDEARLWAASQKRAYLNVVTQGRNIAALRMYEAKNFRVQQVQTWYHLWFEHGPEDWNDSIQ